MSAPQLLSPRRAAIRASVPWKILKAELEKDGKRIVRIGGRERVLEEDLASFIENSRQPTLAESADRVALAIDQVQEEMGLVKRARRAR